MTIDRVPHHGPKGPEPRRQAGFSLAEMLVVVAIIALVMLAVIPAFGNFNRAWRVRSAADEMLSTMRRVRQLAITTHQDVTITFTPSARTYSYTDPIKGNAVTVKLPERVTMVTNPSGAYAPQFRPNGSVVNVSTPSASAPTANYVEILSVINGARTDHYRFGVSAAGQITYTVTRT